MGTGDGGAGMDRELEASQGSSSRLRLAIISTPRSGNTWLRALLASAYGLEQIPVHHPDEIDWENLPERCIIQLHWYPIEDFTASLEKHDVKVVVIARHPLDVLMSWLNYVYYVHQEGICRGEGDCKECGIVGVLPGSEEFVRYAGSYEGRVLLCYSPAWWNREGVSRVHYEDLVADPVGTLEGLFATIGEVARTPSREVVEANAFRKVKPQQKSWHYHYWQGQPGHWRNFLTGEAARAIRAGVPEAFDMLGYACDPDESLASDPADKAWLRLQLESTREYLRLEKAKRQNLAIEVDRLRGGLRESA